MKLTDWLLTLFIIIAFLGGISFQSLSLNMETIRKDWPKYRCNPVYMPFAGQMGEDVSKNFTQCTQGILKDIMGYILKPVNYSLSLLGTLGTRFENSLNMVRKMIHKIRSLATTVFGQIYGVFLNILIEFQRMMIHIRDLMSKLMAVMITFFYILDGSVKTMQSVWKGPPGQLLRGLCFHPKTLIKLKDETVKTIDGIVIGDILENGQIVYATMIIKNTNNSNDYLCNLYKLKNKVLDSKILVSGSHLVKHNEEFIQVCEHPDAILSEKNSKQLICLITDKHTIPIGDYLFGDWEDNGILPWELEHQIKK
jgi:hypothetical protein